MFVPRTLTKSLEKAGTQFPVMFVGGPRQVGKTTLLKESIGKEVPYVSLDALPDRELAQEDPALFIQRYPPPVIIDEVQYAPELFPYIKLEVDRRRTQGLFWLTGSQQFHLMKNLSETLAGRVGILRLLGLSQAECNRRAYASEPFLPTEALLRKAEAATKFRPLMDVYESIWRGCFPAITLGQSDHELFYNAYVQTYIQRDVRDLARVGDEAAFLRFVRATAARSGQLLNMAELGRDVAVDNKTVKQWLSILETSGLIYLLQPYHSNLTKRLIKTPKLYFLDTGLCSYLTRWTSPAALEAGAMSGALFETYIMAEIIKSYWHHGKADFLYFYRDKDQKEIDLLIEQDGTLYPIEFKKTAQPHQRFIQYFSVLEKLDKPIGEGCLICMIEKHLPLNKTVYAVPVSYI